MFLRLCISSLIAVIGAVGEKPVSSNPIVIESFLRTAGNLYHLPDERARAGRLVAICDLLIDSESRDIRAARLVRDVCRSMGRNRQAAISAEMVMNADRSDYGAARKWLVFKLRTLNVAEDRIAFLKSVVDAGRYSASLRSDAAVELATIHIARGSRPAAESVVNKAVELDSGNTEALVLHLEITGKDSSLAEIEMMLSMLRQNPASARLMRELAVGLGRLGLHERSLSLHRRAWSIGKKAGQAPDETAVQATEYLSTLLDSGRHAEAVELFLESRMKYLGSQEFLALLAEACDRAAKTSEAAGIKQQLESRCRQKLSKSVRDGESGNPAVAAAALEMAWLQLLVLNNASRAGEFALQARKAGEKGMGPEIIEGVARLDAKPEEGVKQLTPLAEKHALAAAFLAGHLFSHNDSDGGKRVLQKGLSLGRSGLASRMMTTLAAKHEIGIEKMKGSEAASKLVDGFETSLFEAGQNPGSVVRVTMRPTRKSFAIGEPIQVEFTVENVGKLPLAIGRDAMIDRRIALAVDIEGHRWKNDASLPVIVLPAPRRLAPGAKVSVTERIDAGELDRLLTLNPIDSVKLGIRGVVSPVYRGKTVKSAVPGLDSPSIIVLRSGLKDMAGNAPGTAADKIKLVAGGLGKSLASGKPAERVLTARRIGTLLSWYWQVRQGRVGPGRQIADSLDENQLLGYLARALRDDSSAVRAEMLASLQFAKIPPSSLGRLASAITDANPLVRFRMADLIGSSDTRGRIKLMEIFSRDKNPLVRSIGEVFLRNSGSSRHITDGDSGS